MDYLSPDPILEPIWCAGTANPLSRGSILLQRTAAGEAFLREVKTILAEADREITP